MNRKQRTQRRDRKGGHLGAAGEDSADADLCHAIMGLTEDAG